LYSLAGFRIGYIIASELLLKSLSKIRKGKNVSMISQVAAIETLENNDYFLTKSEIIIKNRTHFVDFASKLSYVKKSYTSGANFVCIELYSNSDDFVNYLENNGVYVRNRNGIEQMKNIVRITIIENIEDVILIMRNYESGQCI
jgi:histidinol-phosphate aminotransferase